MISSGISGHGEKKNFTTFHMMFWCYAYYVLGENFNAFGFGVPSVVINKLRLEMRQLGANRVRVRLNILKIFKKKH